MRLYYHSENFNKYSKIPGGQIDSGDLGGENDAGDSGAFEDDSGFGCRDFYRELVFVGIEKSARGRRALVSALSDGSGHYDHYCLAVAGYPSIAGHCVIEVTIMHLCSFTDYRCKAGVIMV